jgi:hypothetical protein
LGTIIEWTAVELECFEQYFKYGFWWELCTKNDVAIAIKRAAATGSYGTITTYNNTLRTKD